MRWRLGSYMYVLCIGDSTLLKYQNTIERLSILARLIGASVSIERGADLFSF